MAIETTSITEQETVCAEINETTQNEPVQISPENAEPDFNQTTPKTISEKSEKQSAKENAKFAKMRRRETEKFRAQKADLEKSFQERMEKCEEQLRAFSEEKNADGNDISCETNAHAQVQEAENLSMQIAKQQETLQQLSDQKELARELEEIAQFDSNISSVSDMMQLDRFDEIAEKVRRGYTFADAYKSAYGDVVKNAYFQMAQKKYTLADASKSHIQTLSGKGATPQTPMSRAQRAAYRMMGFSDRDADKSFAKYQKK